MIKRFALAACSLFLFCLPLFAQNVHYQLIKQIPVGGEGGWDYLTVDAQNRTLYIAHATQVETLNVDNDSLMAPIPNTEGVHGIAIADREGHGFISCGKSNSVVEFDLVTRTVIQRIPVGDHPDAIIYEPATRHIFVMNGGSNNISVLDGKTGAQVTIIPLPGRPEFAVSDDRGKVFVNLEDKSETVKIDVQTNAVESVWKIAPGEEPSAIAMDRGTNSLFVGCANEKLIVLDAIKGKVVKTFPIGKGVDAAVFDPFTKLAFSANGGDGNVTIVSGTMTGKYHIAQTLETARGARTIALDPHTHDIYLVTAEFGPPPAPTADKPKPRPSIIPGTFKILKYGQNGQ